MVIDFREIPVPGRQASDQDAFELFARDFLTMLGFAVADGPDRGPDGGRDLIVQETREGILKNSVHRMLVSCKHKAHSGMAVGEPDEHNIRDRLEQHRASGFIGFYSTIASSSLASRLSGLANTHGFDVALFDNRRIEQVLLTHHQGGDLVARYFPASYSRWIVNRNRPARLYAEYIPLSCEACGKDLLIERHGIVGMVYAPTRGKDNSRQRAYSRLYVACKGECDNLLQRRHSPKNGAASWQDIADLCIPTDFVRWCASWFLHLHRRNNAYSDEFIEQLRDLIMTLAQAVMRDSSDRELERIRELMTLPTWM